MSTRPLRPEKLRDGREIQMAVTIYNGDYAFDALLSSIRDLIIEETMIDWWSRGYIDIRSYGAVDGSISDVTGKQTYVFRNDCRDYIDIEIDKQLDDSSDESSRLNDPVLTLTHKFVIYSIKDIIEDNIKYKRLFFHDYRYQIFKEKDSTFTTTAYLSGNPSHMSDEDREIPTDEALKMLIYETDAEGREMDDVFTTAWAKGNRNILYTTHAGNCALDDLNNILNDHVDTNDGKCVLHLDRFSGKWSLLPVATLFQNAVKKNQEGAFIEFTPGIWQSEIFTINRMADLEEVESIPVVSRVPKGSNSPYVNIDQEDSSTITQYRYVEMRGDTNHDIFNTTAIHQYDQQRSAFSISMQSTNILSLTKYLQSNIISPLQYRVPDEETPPMSINIAPDRFQTLSLKHEFSSSTSSYAPINFRNNTIWQVLLQSNAIEFDVPGEPNRSSGRFISVQMPSGDIVQNHHGAEQKPGEDKYKDKVEGQYLVISAIHRIVNGDYINRITGIKPYNYTNLFSSDVETVKHYEQV